MAEIPEVFDQPGAMFVLLPDGIKFPPVEKGWQKKPHTFAEAASHATKGGNVGVLAGSGFVGLDMDVFDSFEGLHLPATTTWETRPDRYGAWYKCTDVTPELLRTYGKKSDLAQFKLYHDGLPVGEIKLQRSYQTIPPSWKKLEDGTRADYDMWLTYPPAEISLAKLLADLQAIGITFSSKRDVNAAKLEDIGKKANQRRIECDEKKARRYAEAALKSEVEKVRSASEGDRNDQLFKSTAALGEFVGAGVLSESEVISALERVAVDGEPAKIPRTIRSGLETGRQHPRVIPDTKSAGPKADSSILEGLSEKIKADPRALKEPGILAALAALKANDPVEYDLLLEAIKKAGTGIKVATINDLVDKYIQESEKAADKPPETPEDIIEAARKIRDNGEAYEYIHTIWQKRVKGNEYLGKALLVSRGVQSCLNTKGVHIYSHGKHGHGKSEGMEKMIELVPPEFRMDEDVSPLAIHYASMNGMLLPGTTLLIDEMVWSDSLGGIIKRVITRFQKGAGHLTVIDGESVLVRTQPRLVIWTNSGDLQADEQLRDRFLDEPITEGDNYVKDIIEFQKIRDTLPDSSEDVDRETAICQAILRDLAGRTFTVKIPFATKNQD